MPGVAINTSGKISAAYGIYAVTKGNANGAGSNVGIAIENAGDITASTTAIPARVYASANGAASNACIPIENSGSAFGGTGAGIYAYNNNPIAIVNSGYVSAASLLAINTNGAGNATIYNSGLVKGFILLDADDTFINEKGRVRDQAHQPLWAWLRPLPQRGGRHRARRHRSKRQRA